MFAASSHSDRLPFFPIAERNETVGSTIARYACRVPGLPWYVARSLRLTHLSPSTLVPRDLTRLIELMPPGHPWQNPQEILHSHTGMPYFLFFMPPGKRDEAITKVLTAASRNAHLSFGLAAHARLTQKPVARYCIECVRRDLRIKGFPCYYRHHQLPAVGVCAEHGSSLRFACACRPLGLWDLRRSWMPAGQCDCGDPRPLLVLTGSESKKDIANLRWLARESLSILEAKAIACDEPLALRIKRRLIDGGFGKRSLLDTTAVAHELQSRYGSSLLARLGAGPVLDDDGKPAGWLHHCFEAAALHVQRDPTRLMLFAGLCCKRVLDLVVESTDPPTAGPRPRAWCGYSVRGGAPETRQCSGEAIAAALAKTGGIVYAAARILGIQDQALRGQLLRLEIRLPMRSKMRRTIGAARLRKATSLLTNGVPKCEIQRRLALSEAMLEAIQLDAPELHALHHQAFIAKMRVRHRQQITDLLQRCPDVGRTAVLRTCHGAYQWLAQYDREWFEANVRPMPSHLRASMARKPLDHADRDIALAAKVREVATNLRRSTDRPIRCTRYRLLREAAGWEDVRASARRNYPQLLTALGECAEDREAFLRRRLEWAVQECDRSHVRVTRSSIRDASMLSTPTISDHWEFIESLVNRSQRGTAMTAGASSRQ